MKLDFLYHYKAAVLSAYDADTLRIDIDLGLNISKNNEPVRLSRIDAPEVRGVERPMGLVSRDIVRALLIGQEVTIQTIKDKKGKYGRYIVEMWFEEDGEMINLSDFLVENGLAWYEEY